MDLTPIKVTEDVFERFGAGDVDGILKHLASNVWIQFYGPNSIPYAGEYHGLREARSFFETVLTSVTIHVFEPEQFLCDQNLVTVTGHLHLTANATGVDFKSDFAHIITVEEGRWRRFRDFMDTAAAASAFLAKT